MLQNVYGMGTYWDGGLTEKKIYVCWYNYIEKMWFLKLNDWDKNIIKW